MPAPTKNKNAVKDDLEKSSGYIHARCKKADKAGWVKTAQSKGMKLTEWIVKTLNDATQS